MQINIINQSAHPLPAYATAGSAGMDIRANITASLAIAPSVCVAIPTGLFIELPQGYEAQLRPRSGLAFNKGLTLPNAPGTIDSDYRGEIKVLLINLSDQTQEIAPGERIAQMVIARYEQIVWQPVDALSTTPRGEGGFGSTGRI